jgi:hypothetical protein
LQSFRITGDIERYLHHHFQKVSAGHSDAHATGFEHDVGARVRQKKSRFVGITRGAPIALFGWRPSDGKPERDGQIGVGLEHVG